MKERLVGFSYEKSSTSFVVTLFNARGNTFLDHLFSGIITADGTCAGEVCHVNATCRNLIQGPTCVCKSGYQGSGKTCTGEWLYNRLSIQLKKIKGKTSFLHTEFQPAT